MQRPNFYVTEHYDALVKHNVAKKQVEFPAGKQ